MSRKRGFFSSKKVKREFELLGGVSATAASLLVVSIFLLTSLDKILITSNQYASVIAAVLVDLTNGDRNASNIHGLTINPVLVAVAQAKADDMAAKGYFSHVSPEGKDPWHWFKLVGYKFTYAGENLAVDFSDSADVQRAWMNSPTHRKNLLDPRFTEIGIATAAGFYQGHPTIFVVQAFGAPAASASEPTVASNVPDDPGTLAVAEVMPTAPTQVLGETTDSNVVKPTMEVRPITAGEVVVVPQHSAWYDRLASSPRNFVYITYYVIAALIILSLLIETGLQIRLHHEKKAVTAGLMLALVLGFVFVTNVYLFPHPVLVSENAVQMAAAAAAL